MPKIAKELTAIEVSRLKAPGFVSVGVVAGLALQITPTGARSWVLRIKIGDKRRDVGLGAYPGVTLAQARQRAIEARKEVEQGRDPVEARREARIGIRADQAAAMTFEGAARRFLAIKAPEWKSAKHAAQWGATLETYVFPIIGKLDVKQVTQQHVESILEPIWQTKTETASRLRGRIESVLDWAIAGGYREGDNPARWRGLLDKRLSNPNKIAAVEHYPAVSIDRIPAFYAEVQQHKGVSARALEFTLLTAARSGEVRGATWVEIDLEAAVWTVPAARMKGKREHRVPLSDAALALIKSLPRLEGSDLVFPAPRGGKLSDMALTAVMRRMNIREVPHGLRSSFRDWAGERTNFPREIAEAALAHAIGDATEAAYRRGDALERRRVMMQAWATFIKTPTAQGGQIVAINDNRKAA